MSLFTPAGRLWSHPTYNHSSEGVCTPTIWYRGKGSQAAFELLASTHLKSHTFIRSPSHIPRHLTIHMVWPLKSAQCTLCSFVPLHLFARMVTLINESSGNAALSPVNPFFFTAPNKYLHHAEKYILCPTIAHECICVPAGFHL